MQLRHRAGFARTRHSDTVECWAVHCLFCRWSCLHNSIFRFFKPGAAMRFICHVPGDTNGLIYFLASNGRTWSQPQPPCDDCTLNTMNNVRVIGQQQLQVLSRKAFGRFLFSKSEVMLLCALSQAIVLVCCNRERNKFRPRLHVCLT